VRLPIDPDAVATYDPNAAPGVAAHAAQQRESFAEAISTFSEARAAAAPKQPPSAAALRDLADELSKAP
jgi:hypothetical protein